MEILDKKTIYNDLLRYAPFETFYKCSEIEINQILKFLLFVNENREKITNSQFVQSNFWETLSSARFTGVSNEFLLIKSADRFTSSPGINFHFDTRFENNLITKINFIFRNLKIFIRYYYRWNMQNYSLKTEFNRFEKIYKNFIKPDNHYDFMHYYPVRYIDHLELPQIIEHDQKDTFLEIGPANCVNVALQISLRKIKKTYLIDLPEQISFGYTFLKLFFKDKFKIGLPHEINKENINDFDIVFLLPQQADLIPDSKIDLAMNNSSFQEMKLDVVNNYISLMEKKLRKGGQFISTNQIKAHYIDDNNIDNWKLSNFEVKKLNPAFVNSRRATIKTPNFKQIILDCILK